MPPELRLAVEAKDRVQNEKEELLQAMAYQRCHFCQMEEKAERRKRKLKELEVSLERKAQDCQDMIAKAAQDCQRRQEEKRRIAERREVNANGELVDSEEERYMAAVVRDAEANPLRAARRSVGEEEEELPECSSSPYSYVDDGAPFRHGAYLDNL